MTQMSLMPVPEQQFCDANGVPYAGGKLYFYYPGTSSPKNVYSDSNGTSSLGSTVTLDSAGRAEVWLDGYYKVVLIDSANNTIYTVDNISSGSSSNLTDYQFIDQTDSLTYISGTKFSVPGDKRSIYSGGRRIKAIVSAGTIYGTVAAVAYSTVTTVTVMWESGSLDSGLSLISVGILTPSNNALPILVCFGKTANYSMGYSDQDKIITMNNANSTTLTLLAPDAVPSGTKIVVKNKGLGTVTIAGNIDNETNIYLRKEEAVSLFTDTNRWMSLGQPQIPIGAIIWWHKSLSGVPSLLPWGWVECNGQTLSDSDSLLDGQVIPNINGQDRFIRGSNVSGTSQANQNLQHTHTQTTHTHDTSSMYVKPTANGSNQYFMYEDGTVFYCNQTGANGDFTQILLPKAGDSQAILQGNLANTTAVNANSGSSEARPDNISMVAIMKVK
jgi:hypothetical protein